ncbi:hypothetical protein JQX13_01795 [Archangium violaceum]|uniref:hypothetical protein n=1 Tax=Archangium violaceum TaxID=83451 RepID=UPI00193B3D20|nr:hypothetical protein [Archangium violaceum]QRK08931.1 hypothetical protein JQX13_01795 [Archangium violaceum]
MRRLLMGMVLLWLTGACHTRRSEPPATVRYVEVQCAPCSIEELVLQEAGPSAVDCGWGREPAAWSTVSACVRKADAEGRPFRALVTLQGIDSEIIAGYVRKADGSRWELWYDSNVSGGRGSCNASVSRVSCASLGQGSASTSGAPLTCESPGERMSLCRERTSRKVRLGPVRDATDVECDPADSGKKRRLCVRGQARGNVPAGTPLVCLPWTSGGEDLDCVVSSGEEIPFRALAPEAERELDAK